MIKTKVTRVVKIDNGNEVFIWLENGKLLSCSTDDGLKYKLAFSVKVGDIIGYREESEGKILVESVND